MKYFVILTILVGFIGLSYAQSDNSYSPSGRDYVPYTENYNVRFDSEGRIDYDLLIAKIMPDIFEKKLDVLGVNVNAKDIVLNRGFQHAIYEPQSYNCGYAVDSEMNQIYWLEAAINSTHINYADIYDEIPRDYDFKPGYTDCFSPLEIRIAEMFLLEKSYFTPHEEKLAASAVKHYLRGNENLNKYQFAIGMFNFDYKDDDNQVVLSFCGKFEGRMMGNEYFSGILKRSEEMDFGLKRSLSPLCAMHENPILYDIKFKENPNRDESLQYWKNTRMADVYIKPSSAEKLLERNYLYLESIRHVDFAYASHLDLEYVEYRPENSSTTMKFSPHEKDSHMKIRIPDNGANYYMHYGSEDWHEGELLGISIIIDDKESDYSQFPYVRSPHAPYPQHYTDLVFKVPAYSTDVEIKLDIENYPFDAKEFDKNDWRDYKPD